MKDQIATKQIAPVTALKEKAEMAITVARGFPNLERQRAHPHDIPFHHLLVNRTTLQIKVVWIEARGLGHIEGNRPFVLFVHHPPGQRRSDDFQIEQLLRCCGGPDMVGMIMGEDQFADAPQLDAIVANVLQHQFKAVIHAQPRIDQRQLRPTIK